jgi:hypothetical protein
VSDPTCRGCGQAIVFVRSKANKPIPCDPKELQVVTADGAVLKGRISHFATCPQAASFRKPKTKFEEPQQLFRDSEDPRP